MRMRYAIVVLYMMLGALAKSADNPHYPTGVALNSMKIATNLVSQSSGPTPLYFTKNEGQWDERVLYRTSSGGSTVSFCRDGITYQFTHRVTSHSTDPLDPADLTQGPVTTRAGHTGVRDSVEMVVVRAAFVGANPDVEIVAEDQQQYRCNYFIGNDPTKWRTDVPNFASVTYKGLYPGVDLRYEARDGVLTSSLTALAPSQLDGVAIRWEGGVPVTDLGQGQFRLQTPWGQTVEASRAADGVARIQSVLSASSVTLVYSTSLSGDGAYAGYGIAVDASGSAYVTGYTSSTDFPTAGPYQTDQGGTDVFVTKLSPDGNSLVYSTYIGGGGTDEGEDIVVQGNGSVYVTGHTSSGDFPTAGPFQTDQGGPDVFVTKLGPDGDSLMYSTYLGGGVDDRGFGIDVDGSGSAYVTGWTTSTDFPTVGPYQTDQIEYDVFVTKLSPTGNSLAYSTYLGGGRNDFCLGITVDESGSAYVTGVTGSTDFPTAGPYQTDLGDADVFVTKLSPDGNSLVYSTYLGGGRNDLGYGIDVDGSGSAYVTGLTFSSDFPTAGPYQTNQPTWDAFVTKLSPDGSGLEYSTYLGGGDEDRGFGIAVDGSGSAYVTGWIHSTDFPTARPYQTDQGNIDAFVTKLSPAGNCIVYSSYLGGGGDDFGEGIAVDGSGGVYVTGRGAFVTKMWDTTTCCCACHGDPVCDGVIDNVQDVATIIGIAFRAAATTPDPSVLCPYETFDMNCDGVTNVQDVVKIINVAFRGANVVTEFCSPCP